MIEAMSQIFIMINIINMNTHKAIDEERVVEIAELISEGVKSIIMVQEFIKLGPLRYFTGIADNEHHARYLMDKWTASYVLPREISMPSLSNMLSSKNIRDSDIAKIRDTIQTIDGVEITRKQQVACSWLARIFASSMFIGEMENIFNDKEQAEELIRFLELVGFEEFIARLSKKGVIKCVKWGARMEREKGVIGYDHAILSNLLSSS